MLKARWKGDLAAATQTQAVSTGQIRTFRLESIQPDSKKIEVTLV